MIKVGLTAEDGIVNVDSPEAATTKWVLPTRRVMGKLGRPANWRDEARKALYLFADQANKRPDSEWGQKRKAFKMAYADRHPDKSKGQVHGASGWRMASRLIEKLFDVWIRYEDGERRKAPKPTPEEDAKTHAKPRRWATYAEWQTRQSATSTDQNAAA